MKLKTMKRPSGMDGLLWAQISSGPLLMGFMRWSRVRDVYNLKYYREWGTPVSCMDILKSTHEREATDPKDYIYGALGLMDVPVLVPDYSKSVEKIYMELTRLCLEKEIGQILGLSGFHNMGDLHGGYSILPSWAPSQNNWSSVSKGGGFYHQFTASLCDHSILEKYQPMLQDSNLFVHGIVCENIKEVGVIEYPYVVEDENEDHFEDVFFFCCQYVYNHLRSCKLSDTPPLRKLFRVLLHLKDSASRPLNAQDEDFQRLACGILAYLTWLAGQGLANWGTSTQFLTVANHSGFVRKTL